MLGNGGRDVTVLDLVRERNASKKLFTPGPASLLPENLSGIRPCFGRGDDDYAALEAQVLNDLKALTGHREIVRLQGSASLALEIMGLNFLYGDVLVVDTGYYSERLRWLVESIQRRESEVQSLSVVGWRDMETVRGHYDWVWACSTETSIGLRLPIASLASLAAHVNGRLMLDATASVGLEPDHELADAIAYSSCKGLFGLTGASFIAFNENPHGRVDSFYLDISTHRDHKVTGPYHTIASLADVLPRHAEIRESVVTNKKRFLTRMRRWLTLPEAHQPLLCTHVTCKVVPKDSGVVLYRPRGTVDGSIVCHLGEAHLGKSADGDIIDALAVDDGS